MNKQSGILYLGIVFILLGCNNSTKGHQTILQDPESDTVEIFTPKVAADYHSIGKTIAEETQKVLSKNLKEALQNGGQAHALTFCNSQAIKLTDSMSQVFGIDVKRVSDKPRNQNNRANEKEWAYIQLLKSNLANGQTPESKLTENEGKMIGYYPIVTMDLCLQCHGNRAADIEPQTLKKIRQLYPSDMATGYRKNEIRGLWVVEMKKR